jgi:hypothetical protein
MGQVFPLWCSRLPIVSGISDSRGLILARAGVRCHSSRWYAGEGRRPVQSIQDDLRGGAPRVCRPLDFPLDN